MLLLITGKAHSGKDTLADYIEEKLIDRGILYGRGALAKKLKLLSRIVYESVNSCITNEKTWIIDKDKCNVILMGAKKNPPSEDDYFHLASMVYFSLLGGDGYVRNEELMVPFGREIYDLMRRIVNSEDDLINNDNEEVEFHPRRIFQDFADLCKKQFGSSIWIDILVKEIRPIVTEGGIFIVTDCREIEERNILVDMFPQNYTVKIKREHDSYNRVRPHKSEQGVIPYNIKYNNNSDISCLDMFSTLVAVYVSRTLETLDLPIESSNSLSTVEEGDNILLSPFRLSSNTFFPVD